MWSITNAVLIAASAGARITLAVIVPVLLLAAGPAAAGLTRERPTNPIMSLAEAGQIGGSAFTQAAIGNRESDPETIAPVAAAAPGMAPHRSSARDAMLAVAETGPDPRSKAGRSGSKRALAPDGRKPHKPDARQRRQLQAMYARLIARMAARTR